jgi:uncharacterized protein YraI
MSIRTAVFCVLSTVLTLGVAACNLPSIGSIAPAATGTPVFLPATKTAQPAPPSLTDTPIPTSTPTPTASPTPGPAMVRARDGDVVCRFGPGEEWSIEGNLLDGMVVPIAGRNESSSWWYVKELGYKGKPCWVSAEETQAEGNLADVPVQATPAAFVSVVKVSVEPWKATVTCGDFPYTFAVKFRISTSGPATVQFQRSRNGDEDSAETTVFKTFGTKSYDDEYKVDEVGEYTFRVDVSSPNKISGEATGKMECDPP